jgi:NAD(P)-dependent dehydrogenase (short-subunit alcohol dehydrogenase family)
MDLQLAGKIALVTGASRGIGLAITRALVAEGVTVIGAARAVSPELAGSGAYGITADLATKNGPPELVHAALDRHGEIDILVNNVGGGDAADLRPFFDYDDDLWQKAFELNLFSAVRTCRAAMPSLIRRRGLVVNISSVGARMPHTGPVPYTTAKAALTAYGKALAEECVPHGVGAALAAAQGVSHSDLLAGMAAASGIQSGRLVEPEQVASLVAYLASPRAISMTGQDYLIDGGAIKTA